MKVLYFFAVYKNPEILLRIIDTLQSASSVFLIHVDKRSEFDFHLFQRYSNVHFTSIRYSTPWGGPELPLAIYEGLKEADRYKWDYVCLMSEADYPVKTPEYISQYLEKSQKDHILINQLPCENPLETPGGSWLEGGRRRIECYALRLGDKQIASIEPHKLNWGNIRQLVKILRFNPSKLVKAISLIITKKKRKYSVQDFCGGHLWFFLRRATVEKILDYLGRNPDFISDSAYTQNLDEVFFPTIVNKVIDDKDEISRNILRYISWLDNGSSSPKNITMSDLEVVNKCISDPDTLLLRKISDLDICQYIDTKLQ